MGTAAFEPFNLVTATRFFREWRKLGVNAPSKRRELWYLLSEAHTYPHDGLYIVDQKKLFDDSESLLGPYDELREAAKRFSEALAEITPHWYLLGYSLFDDLRSGPLHRLRKLETSLSWLTKLPPLTAPDGQRRTSVKASAKKSPRRQVDAYPRALALAVGWYILEFEKGRFRVDDDEFDDPKSKGGQIWMATLRGLKVTLELKPFTYLRAAQKRLNIKDKSMSRFGIIEEFGLAMSEKP